LRAGLKNAGLIEGQNLQLEMPALQTHEKLRALVQKFLHQKVNVIVATGNVETDIAKEFAQNIPIVFMPASDPITAGYVKSFVRPGTNLTGIALVRDLAFYGKQLEVFKEVIPSLTKVAVLYDARGDGRVYGKGLQQLKKVASSFAIAVKDLPVRDIGEAEKVVASLSKKSVDGVFVLCSSLFGSGPESIIAPAIQNKLPLFGCDWANQGELASLALDFYHIGRRGSWYVEQILNGAKPSELPVEIPLKYDLSINLKTANKIGVKIPPEVLQQADRIIE
jgi:putative ABC transport system substrate-binding protein